MSAPEQERLNELGPATPIVTSSVPEVDLLPDQEPDALHELAKVDDQVMVTLEFTSAICELAEIVTVAVGNEGAAGPPPPPPPQE